MLSQSMSLPFSIANVYEGFAQAHGMIRSDETGVIIEFEVKDGLLGVLRSGVKEVRIPLDELASTELQCFWLFSRVIIKTKSLAALSKIPNNKVGQVAFWSFGRKNRDIAQRLVSDLKSKMMEEEANRLERVIHQLGDTSI